MEVKHTSQDKIGKFSLLHEEKEIGEMTYIYVNEHVIDINHTLIDNNYRGKDLGLKLIEASVEFMRKHNLKAIPSCPYVEKIFDATPEYTDVRA